MTRRIYRLLGAVAIAAFGAACKGDPLADTGGTLSRLDLEYAYREVIIGDSTRTFAIERDALNTPLPPTATVRSCNSAIASVRSASDAPLQRTGFYIKALTYGSTCVIAEAGALADTTQVSTFPATISLTGPDSIQSGAVTPFGWVFRDRTGNPVAGVPAPTFSSGDTTIGYVQPPVGSVSGRNTGLFTLTVTGTGSPPGGVSIGKGVTVIPGTFTGALAPTAGNPGDAVKATKGASDPVIDADTRVAVNGVRTFFFNSAPDSLRFVVPGVGVAGTVPVVISNMGPLQVALAKPFTSSTASFADSYDAVNDDPTTAPAITTNGDYFLVMHGTCKDGVVTDPGDDCDDFFTITNAGAVPDTMTVRLDWFDTPADVDILWCNAACSAFVGNFAGATGSNPENSTVFVPAGVTWRLYINLFAPGAASTIVRVRVTNKN
jgi:hypothetical protein